MSYRLLDQTCCRDEYTTIILSNEFDERQATHERLLDDIGSSESQFEAMLDCGLELESRPRSLTTTARMHPCMHARTHLRSHACMHARAHAARVHARKQPHMQVCMHASVHAHMRARTQPRHGTARPSTARHGSAWHGTAQHGTAARSHAGTDGMNGTL